MTTTKLYNRYQTIIPAEIRKKIEIDPDSLVEWSINKEGKVELEFRKKSTFEDIIGIGNTDEKTNAVELKKKGQMK
ncbi:MAG: AbrB/MazE/SpoVT family DNA-binding domain-containing protein [Methanobacteriaceae archaeon]